MSAGDETWRDRLQALVDASGRSMRDVSLGAGLSAGYLHSVLQDGKDPTMRSLVLVMQELGAPVGSLFEDGMPPEIIGLLREHEASETAEEVCDRHGISQRTFYMWNCLLYTSDAADEL